MALTQEQEKKVVEMLAAFDGAKRINELESASGSLADMTMVVQDETGETRRLPVLEAVAVANNPIAGRYWDETASTPRAKGYFGSVTALKELPSRLGLGRYLVTDDRVRRKLDPTDSTKFEDGSPAALDGSMGQCMWCWNAHYFTTWKEGNYTYEVVTFAPIEGKKSIYIPAGGTSWLGFGVVDRTNLKLCSVISDAEQFRGGANAIRPLETHPNLPEGSAQQTMLGMPASYLSTRAFGEYARKRGEGWEANWFVARAVMEYLMRIILGTRNSQEAYNAVLDENGLYQCGMGLGVINMPDWNGYNGAYPIIPTNVGLEMGDGTGIVNYDVPAADGSVYYKAPVPVFFGLVHAGIGHLWAGIRGLVIDAGEAETAAYIAPSMYAVFDDSKIEGKLLAAKLPRVSGYIKRLSMNLLCAMPTEVGGSGATYFADYFYTNAESSKGFRVRLAGGSSYNGTDAGASCTYSNYAATAAGTYFSAALCFFTEDPVISE